MNIYVATSWKNPWQTHVVQYLRELGHTVYDFKQPSEGVKGFSWDDVDPNWQSWSKEEYRKALLHPRSMEGFKADMDALRAADCVLLVAPCGASAHLELGYAAGKGKRTAVLYPYGFVPDGHDLDDYPCSVCGDLTGTCLKEKLDSAPPELMVKMADQILLNRPELNRWLKAAEFVVNRPRG